MSLCLCVHGFICLMEHFSHFWVTQQQDETNLPDPLLVALFSSCLIGQIFFIRFCFFSGHFSGYLYWLLHSQFKFYDIWMFNLQWKCHILTFEPYNLSIPQTVHLMYSLYINMWTFLLDFTTVVGQSNSGGKAKGLIYHAQMLWCSWARHLLP